MKVKFYVVWDDNKEKCTLAIEDNDVFFYLTEDEVHLIFDRDGGVVNVLYMETNLYKLLFDVKDNLEKVYSILKKYVHKEEGVSEFFELYEDVNGDISIGEIEFSEEGKGGLFYSI